MSDSPHRSGHSCCDTLSEQRLSAVVAREPDELVEHLARMLAKARSGDNVYMSGEHNPVPTEYQRARMFVEDFVAPLRSEVERERQRADEAEEQYEKLLEAAGG